VEARAQMKYHHLERCFTNRMKRPVAFFAVSTGAAPSWFGIFGGNPAFTRWGLGRLPTFSDPRVRRETVRASWGPNRGELCANYRALRGAVGVLFRDICQMGSLAGAAYLLHDNAGVLRQAQWEQNSHVEHKRKGLLD